MGFDPGARCSGRYWYPVTLLHSSVAERGRRGMEELGDQEERACRDSVGWQLQEIRERRLLIDEGLLR